MFICILSLTVHYFTIMRRACIRAATFPVCPKSSIHAYPSTFPFFHALATACVFWYTPVSYTFCSPLPAKSPQVAGRDGFCTGLRLSSPGRRFVGARRKGALNFKLAKRRNAHSHSLPHTLQDWDFLRGSQEVSQVLWDLGLVGTSPSSFWSLCASFYLQQPDRKRLPSLMPFSLPTTLPPL
jgi:hypothetical protein